MYTGRNVDLSLSAPQSEARLSGSLPAKWASLTRLQILDLNNQGISGVLSLSVSGSVLDMLFVCAKSSKRSQGECADGRNERYRKNSRI